MNNNAKNRQYLQIAIENNSKHLLERDICSFVANSEQSQRAESTNLLEDDFVRIHVQQFVRLVRHLFVF